MPFDSDRPRPVPLPISLVVKKGSMMRDTSGAGTPGPLSATAIWTSPLTTPVVTRTRRSGALATASKAFDNRFTITCEICVPQATHTPRERDRPSNWLVISLTTASSHRSQPDALRIAIWVIAAAPVNGSRVARGFPGLLRPVERQPPARGHAPPRADEAAH